MATDHRLLMDISKVGHDYLLSCLSKLNFRRVSFKYEVMFLPGQRAGFLHLLKVIRPQAQCPPPGL